MPSNTTSSIKRHVPSSQRFTIWALAICIVAAVSFISCNRDKTETPFTLLQGKWKLAQTAEDDNNNGVIDAGELHNVDSADNETITFDKDSSGVDEIIYDTVTTDYYFTWLLPNGADSLVRNYTEHYTILSHIDDLSGNELTLRNYPNDSNPVLAWYFYKKE